MVSIAEPVSNAELRRRLVRDPERFEGDPDVEVLLTSERYFNQASSVFDLSLSYVMGHATLPLGSVNKSTLFQDGFRELYRVYRKGSQKQAFQADGLLYGMEVLYASVALKGIAGRHDKSAPGAPKRVDNVAMKKDYGERMKKKIQESLNKEDVVRYALILFEYMEFFTRPRLLEYLRQTGFQASQRAVQAALSDVSDTRYHRDLKKFVYYLKPAFRAAVPELRPGPVRAPPPPMPRKNDGDNTLFYIDFERGKIKASGKDTLDLGTSMYVGGVASVQLIAGEQQPQTFTFAVHIFKNGAIKVNLGFRDTRFKRLSEQDLSSIPAPRYLAHVAQWYVQNMLRADVELKMTTSGVSVSGVLNKNYSFADKPLAEQRAILKRALQQKLRTTYVGIRPVGLFEEDMIELDLEQEIGSDEEDVYAALQEAVATQRDDGEPGTLSRAAYVRQHMDAWKFELNPQAPLEDLMTYTDMEITSPTFIKLTEVTLKQEAMSLPLMQAFARDPALWEKTFGYVTVEKTREVVRVQRIEDEEQGARLLEEIRDAWLWSWYRSTDAQVPFTQVLTPVDYGGLFSKPILVNFWWNAKKLSLVTTDDGRPVPFARSAWDAMRFAWYALARLFQREGPAASQSPIVSMDDVYDAEFEAALDDHLKPRKHGHRRYSEKKTRPGKKQGTTCEPLSRVPNPQDPYDWEAVCGPNPETGEARVVLPDKFGNPCCFERPEPLTTAWKSKILRQYNKFMQAMPKLVLALLGVNDQPDYEDASWRDAFKLSFGKDGRLLVNNKIATKLNIGTIERIAENYGIPTVENDKRSTPVDGPNLVRRMSWKLLLEGGGEQVKDKTVDFYVGLLNQLSPKMPWKRHSTVQRYEQMMPTVKKRVGTWLESLYQTNADALGENIDQLFPERIEWENVDAARRPADIPQRQFPTEWIQPDTTALVQMMQPRPRQKSKKQAERDALFLAKQQQDKEEADLRLAQQTQQYMQRLRDEEAQRRAGPLPEAETEVF